MAQYETIRSLRLTHVPLFEGKGVSEVRPVVIARVKNLEYFNGSGVSPRERRDAEKTYLRRVKRDYMDTLRDSEPTSATSDVVSEEEQRFYSVQHPRAIELLEKYKDELVPFGCSRVGGAQTLVEELTSLTFHNLCFSATTVVTDPVVKKVPLSISVEKLKQVVKAVFQLDVPVDLLRLSYRRYKDSPPTLLDDDQAAIQYFGVTTEGDLFINHVKE